MKKERKIILWFAGTLLLPHFSWLIFARFFEIWTTKELFSIIFRINIPAYVLIVAPIIFFIVIRKLNNIGKFFKAPTPKGLIKAQKSARFIPLFFLFILPFYTLGGYIPGLLPFDFIDKTELIIASAMGVTIVFLFAVPFFIVLNIHLEKFTKDLAFSKKYKPLSIGNKITIIFLMNIVGISIFYLCGVIGVIHNNGAENIIPVLIKKISIASIFIILITIINIKLLKKQIIKPILRVKKNMFEIAEGHGDLTKRVKIEARDEIGELSFWFNKFIENINSIILNLSKTASSLSSTGNQLSSMSEVISNAANVQSSTTEEILSSMEEIVALLTSNTENAKKTNEITSKSAKEIIQNKNIFKEAVSTVKEISEHSLIIEDISFQTNILSLNASIEASKAGISGRGFTVVAHEINILAEKSKKASKEIIKQSESGISASQKANDSLENITSKIENSAKLVAEIIKMNIEQQEGIITINNSINKLSEITTENSISSERMAESAKELKLQAKQLKEIISQFKTK